MKNLKNLPVTDINGYILESQEISYILEHNPDLIINEEIRINIGYEYFGLIKADTVYYAITKRDLIYAGLSKVEAVEKMLKSIKTYINHSSVYFNINMKL